MAGTMAVLRPPSLWNAASGDAPPAESGRRRLHGEPEAARVEHRSQAVQRWIAGLRKHAIKALAVPAGIARHGPDSAMGIGEVTKSQKKHARVFVLEASVQIVSGLFRVPERFQKTLTIGFGVTGESWHPNTLSSISLRRIGNLCVHSLTCPEGAQVQKYLLSRARKQAVGR
jgi:hypothetical protein